MYISRGFTFPMSILSVIDHIHNNIIKPNEPASVTDALFEQDLQRCLIIYIKSLSKYHNKLDNAVFTINRVLSKGRLLFY